MYYRLYFDVIPHIYLGRQISSKHLITPTLFYNLVFDVIELNHFIFSK